ncbi:MAG TPA: hypothetical protein EYH31_10210 [Anaerolineae bacterium]|nr:hypothetical protein [Anaerolineae bacterium]
MPSFCFYISDELLVAPDVDEGDWAVIELGVCWGEPGRDFILCTTFTVPADRQPPVVLFLPIDNIPDTATTDRTGQSEVFHDAAMSSAWRPPACTDF